MAGPTITTNKALVAEYYDRLLLDNLYPSLKFYQFADKKRLPSGMGKVAHWTKYSKLIAAGAITEQTVLGISDLSATRISAMVGGHGIAVKHTDFIIMTGISDIVTDSVNEVSKSLALKVDTVTRSAISNQGTVQGGFSAAVGSVINTTPLTENDILNAVTALDSNDAKRFPDGNFVCIAHPKSFMSIKGRTAANSWVEVNKYANSETVGKIYRGEVGMLHGVRFVMSSQVPKLFEEGATSATTGLSGGVSGYNAYVFGAGAYGVVELDGGSAKTYIKQLGSAGTADPINQFATVGAKIYFAAANLDCANRMVRIAHGHTPTIAY